MAGVATAGLVIATVVQVVTNPSATVDVVGLTSAVEAGAAEWLVGARLLRAGKPRLTLDDEIRACGQENACVARAFAKSGAGYGVYVVANFEVEPALVSMEIFRAGSPRAIAQQLVDPSDDPAGALRAAVERALADAGCRVGGRLAVTTQPPDAAVTVTPPIDLSAPAPAGTYTVAATQGGFAGASSTVVVDVRKVTEARLVLEPDAAVSWWVWAGIGAAVVVAGAVVAAVALQPDEVEFCHPVGGMAC